MLLARAAVALGENLRRRRDKPPRQAPSRARSLSGGAIVRTVWAAVVPRAWLFPLTYSQRSRCRPPGLSWAWPPQPASNGPQPSDIHTQPMEPQWASNGLIIEVTASLSVKNLTLLLPAPVKNLTTQVPAPGKNLPLSLTWACSGPPSLHTMPAWPVLSRITMPETAFPGSAFPSRLPSRFGARQPGLTSCTAPRLRAGTPPKF